MFKLLVVASVLTLLSCTTENNGTGNNGSTNNASTNNGATNNVTSNNSTTSDDPRNDAVTNSGDDFINHVSRGEYRVVLRGGPYGSYDVTGTGLKSDTRYDEQSSTWFLYFELPDASFRFGDLEPGLHDLSETRVTFYIETDLEPDFLEVDLNVGQLEIESRDTATGTVKARVRATIPAADSGFDGDVALDAAFDLEL